MSFNLYLQYVDAKGRTVRKVDLVQMTTSATFQILGLEDAAGKRIETPQDQTYEQTREKYLAVCKTTQDKASWSENNERSRLYKEHSVYGYDYRAEWYWL